MAEHRQQRPLQQGRGDLLQQQDVGVGGQQGPQDAEGARLGVSVIEPVDVPGDDPQGYALASVLTPGGGDGTLGSWAAGFALRCGSGGRKVS